MLSNPRGSSPEAARSAAPAAPRFLTSDSPHKSTASPEALFDLDDGPIPPPEESFVARLLSFSPGGFEGSCYWRTLDGYRKQNPLGLVRAVPRPPKSREEKAQEHATRARRRVRWLCREIGADHLLTLTTREGLNSRASVFAKYSRFVKDYRKATGGREWLYVAIAEPHPSNPGHWHVHVACRGGVRIRTANAVWWKICGGRGEGNVDVKRFKTLDGDVGSVSLARYIAKYVVKGFGLDDPDREVRERRFRASVVTLEARRTLILAADHPNVALRRLLEVLRLGRGELQVFMYSDGSGFWFSCSGELVVEDPF